MRGLLSVVIACSTLTFTLTLSQADDLIICSDHVAAVDEQIESCTNLVKKRNLSREDLSLAYSHRALAYQRVKSYRKALLDFQKSVRLKPNDTKIRLNLGVTYEKLGQFGRAIANYTISIKSDPKFSMAYFNRANAFEAKGDLNKAIADYKQSIQLNVKDADALNNLANAYYKSGLHDKAQETYQKALEIDPEHRFASLNLKQIFDTSIAQTSESVKSETSAIIDSKEAETVSDQVVSSTVTAEKQELKEKLQNSAPLKEISTAQPLKASQPLKEDIQSSETETKEKQEEETFSLPPGVIVSGSY